MLPQIPIVECFDVICSFTIDDVFYNATYNGDLLTYTGNAGLGSLKTVNFQYCGNDPGALVIAGKDNNVGNNCVAGGLILHCTANVTTTPWYNFVSNDTFWQDDSGHAPCETSSGGVLDGNIGFIQDLVDLGAKKIWSYQQEVTLTATPGMSRLCGVTCTFIIDNVVLNATYNGEPLTISGNLESLFTPKAVRFFCDNENPGILTVAGTDNDIGSNNCNSGGLLMHCEADNVTNPWHNFVSDDVYWVDENNERPCQRTTGGYLGSSQSIVTDLLSQGAKSIWALRNTVSLTATPDNGRPCEVTCTFIIDDVVSGAKYNGESLALEGNLNALFQPKTVVFFCEDNDNPGNLTITGTDNNVGNNCNSGGMLLHCVAEDESSPWHNFVSDDVYWVDENNERPCQRTSGGYLGSSQSIVTDLLNQGAKSIWATRNTVSLTATPGNGRPCEVTCTFIIDDIVMEATYNGDSLPIEGNLNALFQPKTVVFFCEDNDNPGTLTITGMDNNVGNNCNSGGMLLHCVAEDESSPWHNFVSNASNWVDENDATPCERTTGGYLGTSHSIITALLGQGAKSIWAARQVVSLTASP